MENEIWKDIEGYEGLYQVSNLGRIRSLDKYVKTKGDSFRISKGLILTPHINKNNRRQVCLCNEGQERLFYVYRLVYETFVSPIPKGMHINHINENSLDDRLENLNLMTPKENTNWGTAIERRSRHRKKPVTQILPDGTPFFTYFSARDIEKELFIDHRSISCCCKGKYKTAGGFKWEYATPGPRT